MQLSQFCCGVYLFSCLNPFHHFAPDDGSILLSCSLPCPALSPTPFLIFSHFLSIPSPLHSHQSVLVQINFPKPFSFYRQLSNLITIFLSYASYTQFFSRDCYSSFTFPASLLLLLSLSAMISSSFLYHSLASFASLLMLTHYQLICIQMNR